MDESASAKDEDSADMNKQAGPETGDGSGSPQVGDAADSGKQGGNTVDLVDIALDGDVVLDVTFITSKETLKLARRAVQSSASRKPANAPVLKPQVRIAYRVRLAALTQVSAYFKNMLSDPRFAEGRAVKEAFEKLKTRGIKPQDAEMGDLPSVKIVDDDKATCSAGRDTAFGDMLRILHGTDTVTKSPGMQYVAVLTVLADRFDCLLPVSRYVKSRMQFKWPLEKPRTIGRDGDRLAAAQEELVRQKILVAWLLDRPPNFHAATRELVMTGSVRWSAYVEETHMQRATWWDLQDGIERELLFRRECVLNTIASVPRHFLKLYTSRTRQCRLGYDSSASCDSYQLGEMIKFLTGRRLLFLVDFSPSSLDEVPEQAVADVSEIIATLKQCPAYQIDKNHTNCGVRTRMLPIIQYIEACLGQYCVGLVRSAWAKDQDEASWVAQAEKAEREDVDRTFRFTRAMSGDHRLRFADAMGSARLARTLFTASSWDWTPEE